MATTRPPASFTFFAAGFALLAGTASAGGDGVPFPLDVTDPDGLLGSVELAPDGAALARLAARTSVRLEDVPLPGDGRADLDLERIRFDVTAIGLSVDGVPSGSVAAGDQTFWKGSVVGSADSTVYLAFSSTGSYGWIHDGDLRISLTSHPGPESDWSRSTARLFSDDTIPFMNEGELCGAGEGSGPGYDEPALDVTTITSNAVGNQTLWCKVAVETDWQFFSMFGDLTATTTYATSLLAAMSDRFDGQIDVQITFPYLGIWTTPNDPWTAHDNGGTIQALLAQFRAAWQNNIPGDSHLGHFLSGEDFTGGFFGYAYIDVLCSQTNGFSAAGHLNGAVQFPVTQSVTSWDFNLACHELGHNFGAIHTHQYCPPLDECAGPQFFGPCQNQQVCITTGTTMSYCHRCPGDAANVTTFFHTVSAAKMRQEAENSCLMPCPGGATAYCVAAPNSASPSGALMGLTGSTSVQANDAFLAVGAAPPGEFGIFFYGPAPAQTPAGDGWLCVSSGPLGFQRLFPATQADALGQNGHSLDLTAPPASSGPGEILPGSTWYFQHWYRDPAGGPAGYNFSDGLEVLFCP